MVCALKQSPAARFHLDEDFILHCYRLAGSAATDDFFFGFDCRFTQRGAEEDVTLILVFLVWNRDCFFL